MNKIYLLTAAFAVMASLSGCSDTELASIDTAQEKTPIGFHTVGSQMGSRAQSINTEKLKGYNFNVYAFARNEADASDGALFMGTEDTQPGNGGVTISHNGSNWNYADPNNLKYWPTGALNFYAVSPVSKSESVPTAYTWQISQNTKVINYLSSDEYGNGTFPYTDVMYAIALNRSKTENGGKVQLQFRHITSQVVFMAKKQLSDMVVKIKSIKLHNFDTSGTFSIPTNGTDPQQSNWKTTYILNKSGFTVIKDEEIDVKTDATDISTRKPMFLIPQQKGAWIPSHNIATADNNEECYLSIDCNIYVNGSYEVGSAGSYGTIYVPFKADWQPGKRYVYTLVFGGGYDANGHAILQPINFEPDVQAWKEDATTGNDILLYQ